MDWEALGLTYGMHMFRPYLAGSPFHAWVVPLFNHRNRPAPIMITKFRHQVGDLSFTVKHIP